MALQRLQKRLGYAAPLFQFTDRLHRSILVNTVDFLMRARHKRNQLLDQLVPHARFARARRRRAKAA